MHAVTHAPPMGRIRFRAAFALLAATAWLLTPLAGADAQGAQSVSDDLSGSQCRAPWLEAIQPGAAAPIACAYNLRLHVSLAGPCDASGACPLRVDAVMAGMAYAPHLLEASLLLDNPGSDARACGEGCSVLCDGHIVGQFVTCSEDALVVAQGWPGRCNALRFSGLLEIDGGFETGLAGAGHQLCEDAEGTAFLT